MWEKAQLSSKGATCRSAAVWWAIIKRVRSPRAASNSWLARALIVAAALFVGLGIGEIGLQLFGRLGHGPFLHSEYLLDDPSQRLLDTDLSLVLPRLADPAHYSANPSLPTLVAIGDSFTEGLAVEEDHSYPAALKRILAREGFAANVINAGQADSGPDQQLRLFERYVLPNLAPGIVVWTFFGNDVSDNYTTPVYDIAGGELVALDASRNFLHIRHKLILGFPLPLAVKQSSGLFRLLLKSTELLEGRDAPSGQVERRRKWALDKLRLELLEMRRLGEQKRFQLYPVLISPEARYFQQSDPQQWSEFWAIEQTQYLRPVLEIQPNFIDAWFPGVDPDEIFTRRPQEDSIVGGRHFNEAGYALLAETIAARILEDRGRRSAF